MRQRPPRVDSVDRPSPWIPHRRRPTARVTPQVTATSGTRSSLRRASTRRPSPTAASARTRPTGAFPQPLFSTSGTPGHQRRPRGQHRPDRRRAGGVRPRRSSRRTSSPPARTTSASLAPSAGETETYYVDRRSPSASTRFGLPGLGAGRDRGRSGAGLAGTPGDGELTANFTPGAPPIRLRPQFDATATPAGRRYSR